MILTAARAGALDETVREERARLRVEELRHVARRDPPVLPKRGPDLVANLARPGGNLTGIANPEYTITAKLVEILKEMAPGTTIR